MRTPKKQVGEDEHDNEFISTQYGDTPSQDDLIAIAFQNAVYQSQDMATCVNENEESKCV